MTLSVAYIFQHQKLLVDANLQLPKVEKLASDLVVQHQDHVIARDLFVDETIPEGYQLMPIRELIQIWSVAEFLQASRAVQLLEWRRNHKFCSHCGHATEIHAVEYAMVCPACGYSQYPRVQPCIITIITKGDHQVLLAKSAHHKSNMYGLIAGFVEVGETLEEAVQREVLDQGQVHGHGGNGAAGEAHAQQLRVLRGRAQCLQQEIAPHGVEDQGGAPALRGLLDLGGQVAGRGTAIFPLGLFQGLAAGGDFFGGKQGRNSQQHGDGQEGMVGAMMVCARNPAAQGGERGWCGVSDTDPWLSK